MHMRERKIWRVRNRERGRLAEKEMGRQKEQHGGRKRFAAEPGLSSQKEQTSCQGYCRPDHCTPNPGLADAGPRTCTRLTQEIYLENEELEEYQRLCVHREGHIWSGGGGGTTCFRDSLAEAEILRELDQGMAHVGSQELAQRSRHSAQTQSQIDQNARSETLAWTRVDGEIKTK